MNVFNRIVTVLALILLWLLVALLAGLPDLAISWAQLGLNWLGQSLQVLGSLRPAWVYPTLRAAVVALTTIVVLVLLWLELRRRRTPAVKVQLQSGGEAAVTADSVARRLAWHIDQLADVISVHPAVQARGGGVNVRLDLETAPEVEVPMKTEEVMAVTRDVIESQMGLQLRHLKVDIRHAPYPEPL